MNCFHIVGSGGASTYYVKITSHIVVSPTGEIIASVDNFSEEYV
jgi:hypothetical protein